MNMTRKKSERPPTADEMRARRLDVLRANPPKPRKGESPEEWKKRLDSYRNEIREAKEDKKSSP
jgi:hypothetical protein